MQLHEAARLLGLWQTTRAQQLARSLSHDVAALERAARAVSAKLTGVVRCEGERGAAAVWWAPVGAAALWALALWVRSRLARAADAKLDKIY
eukprot:359083-Chlamydomonas_euryale.AAC.8